MANFFDTIWKELLWVFSPDKQYGGLSIQNGDYKSLTYALPISVALLSLRYVLAKYCFEPFGKYLGVKSVKHKEAPPSPVLEEVYLKGRRRMEIVGLAKQLDISERQIEKWLYQRRRQDRPSVLKKFCESCWKFTYYSCLFSYGIFVLWDKSWFSDIAQCWTGFPHQDITSDIWWYYIISLSYYWSLFFSHYLIDVRRKDFWQMLIHHITTILLLSFSWLASYYRVGSLVLVVHDFADIFLELAKMVKYAKYETTCNAVFGFFTVAWIVTRLGIFPLWIVRHTVFESMKYVPNIPVYYSFNSMLVLLVVLHSFWTYLILKIAYTAVKAGRFEKDVRSSSDDDDD